MGIESLQKRQTFGIEELGLLDRTPLKTLDMIVALSAEALQVPIAALMVFDDQSGSIFLRSVVGETPVEPGVLSTKADDSASALVRDQASIISITNLAFRQDTYNSTERQKFGATGLLAAPVHGPIGDVIAVLAGMTPEESHWTRRQRKLISDYAFLACEQIMLRAALHTVKLMGQEREAWGALTRYPA